MTAQPRLIGAILSNKPDDPKFVARLTGVEDCSCTIEVDDMMQCGFIQVTASTRIEKIRSKYFDLVVTARSLPDQKRYIVEFSLRRTTILEGAEVIRMLFEKDLEAQYWYQLASSTMICAMLDPASRRVKFMFLPENAVNTPENWQRFAEQLLAAPNQHEAISASLDRVEVVLTAESWEKWEEVVPQLAALFPV